MESLVDGLESDGRFDGWTGVRRNVLFIDGLESNGTLDGGVVNGV
jgi:hypothetical protein